MLCPVCAVGKLPYQENADEIILKDGKDGNTEKITERIVKRTCPECGSLIEDTYLSTRKVLAYGDNLPREGELITPDY